MAAGEGGPSQFIARRANNANGVYNLTVAPQFVTLARAGLTDSNYIAARCAAACFTARQALSTVPYVSQGQPRSITLVYDGDQLAVRPVAQLTASVGAGGPATAGYQVSAKDSAGATITFVNGETTLRFAGGLSAGAAATFGAQFDAVARNWPTGQHRITAFVRTDYGLGYFEVDTISVRVLVVNERNSPVAKGWSIAGLQRITRVGSTGQHAIITAGDGSLAFFASSGASTFATPSGDFTRLEVVTGGGAVAYRRNYPDSTRAEFDAQGRLISIVSPTFADTVQFAYDGSGRLIRVYDPFRTDPGGLVHLYSELSYGTNGLQSITEPGQVKTQTGGRVTSVSVAGDRTLQSWTDPDGVNTRLRYDASGRLGTLINRRGDTSFFAYDAATWKLTSVAAPSFAVDPNVYGAGQTRRLSTTFRPWQTIAVPVVSTATTPFPLVRADTARGSATAPGNLTTALKPDIWGQPLASVVRPGFSDSLVTQVTRDRNGMPFTVTSPTGAADHYIFSDTTGLLTKQALQGQNAVDIGYQAFGQVASVTSTGQPATTYALQSGSRGLVQSMTIGGSYTTNYFYDARKRIQQVVDPLLHTTDLGYDLTYGTLVHTARQGDHITDVDLDGYGRDSVARSAPLPAQRSFYDLMNRDTLRVRDGTLTTKDSVTYNYDSLYLTNVRPATSSGSTQSNAIGRNAYGAVTTEADPAGSQRQYFYDDRGLVRRWVNARGDSVVTQYDAFLRPSVVAAWRGSTKVRADTFAYSISTLPGQRFTAAKNNHSVDTVWTDATGWVDSVVTVFRTDVNKKYRISYRKDANGRLDQVRVVPAAGIDSTVRGFTWSAANGTLTGATVKGFSFTLQPDGELLPQLFSQPGGVQRTDNQTTTHRDFANQFSPTGIGNALSRGMLLDSLSRITSAMRPDGALNYYVTSYRYDSRGRLVAAADTFFAYPQNSPCNPPPNGDFGVKRCTSPAPTQVSQQFKDSVAFDRVDNIVSNTGHGGTGTPTYSNNRIVTWPGFSYATDADGNVITKSVSPSGAVVANYYWSPDGLLDSVVTPTQYVRYDYNAFGLLVRKWTSRTAPTPDRHFLWDQGHLALELNGALNTRIGEYAYLPGTDRPLAFITNSITGRGVRVLYQDAQGSVMGLVGTDGTLLASQKSSDPWGVTSTWSVGLVMPDTMRLGWQGLMAERAPANLYYARARWYDPVTKRFLSPDPLGVAAGVNRYLFASGDPMNQKDPSGLESDCIRALVNYGTVVGSFGRQEEEPPQYVTVCWNTRTSRFEPGGGPAAPGGPSIGPAAPLPPPPTTNRRYACAAAVFDVTLSAATDIAFFAGVGLVAKAARGAGGLDVLRRVGGLWAYDYLGLAPGKTKGSYNKLGLSREASGRPRSNIANVAGVSGTAAFNLGVAPILSDGFWDFVGGFVPGIATLDAGRDAYQSCFK